MTRMCWISLCANKHK